MRDDIVVVGYQAYDFAKSLVVGEIRFFDFEIDFEGVDCLIFTSKNAIFALNRNAKKHPKMQVWKEIPSYVIGKKSAKALGDLGGNVVYIGSNAHGKEFGEEILEALRDKRCVYIRGKEIVSNLDKNLTRGGIELASVVGYESCLNSSLSSSDAPKDGSYLLFTAPSTYRFFKNLFSWKENYVAVALGKTTFEFLDQGIKKILSPHQDIKKSVEFLQSQ